MARRDLFVGFVAGVLAGVVATITPMGGRPIPRAMAEDVQPRVLLPPPGARAGLGSASPGPADPGRGSPAPADGDATLPDLHLGPLRGAR